jgi:hypothetical protein
MLHGIHTLYTGNIVDIQLTSGDSFRLASTTQSHSAQNMSRIQTPSRQPRWNVSQSLTPRPRASSCSRATPILPAGQVRSGQVNHWSVQCSAVCMTGQNKEASLTVAKGSGKHAFSFGSERVEFGRLEKFESSQDFLILVT